MKCIAVAVALVMAGAAASAQQVSKSDPEVVFNHHWFLQVRGGVAYTIGEGDYNTFGDLLSGNAQLYAGYQFTPVWGLRFGAEAWQAKGGWAAPRTIYDYNYIQGNIDVMVDLSNWWGGYRHDRFFDAYFFIGPGINGAFNNDEACALNDAGYPLANLWRDHKISIAGHTGLGANLRLGDHVAINLELGASMLSDDFNSKDADNPDWQFTGTAGFTFSFGKTHKRVAKAAPAPEPYVAPEPAPAPAPEPEPEPEPVVEAPAPVEAATLSEDIYFLINSAQIRESEQSKVASLIDFMTEHESAKVEICGYSDADTGTAAFNLKLSQQRAEAVAKALKDAGISADRITVDYKGDTVQPYDTVDKNRVAICIAE